MGSQLPAPRHHSLSSEALLPLFDTLFGVALTFLAYSLPEQLMGAMDIGKLVSTIAVYLLSAVIVLLYWYRMRRLVVVTRVLYSFQLVLVLAGLVVVVMLPRLAQLVIVYGGGTGDLSNWTPSQIVNTVFLFFLGFYDLVCLVYGCSLLRHSHVSSAERRRLAAQVRIQAVGVTVLIFLGFLELASVRFNNEYIVVIPVVLLIQEWQMSRVIARQSGVSV
jgi:uncharacterized membrane protein